MIRKRVAAEAKSWRLRAPVHARRFLVSCGWLLCMGVLTAGCSQRTPRYPVEGMLMIDGRPAPQGLRVRFGPEETQAVPVELQDEAFTGVTNDSGRYVAYYRPGMKGLPAGRYVVSIVSPDDKTDGMVFVPPWLAAIKIPDRYRTGRSTLTCDVRRGGTVFDIDVQTK